MSSTPAPAELFLAALPSATDADLARWAAAVADEQHRRALAAGDVEAIVEEAFADGFTSAGLARAPYLRHGMLICPGSLLAKSRTSHECSFVTVDSMWVWEYPDRLTSVLRRSADAKVQRSVALVLPWEGMAVDQVQMKQRMGSHQLSRATSYVLRGGVLVEVSTRTVRTDHS